jgi:hypothetical protein
MDVAAEFQKIIVRIYQYSFDPPLVEVSDAVVAAVVAGGVAYIKMPHEFGRLPFGVSTIRWK